MKTVLLMRHAKSSWKNTEIEDHERPLNKRGEKDAPMMGSLIREKKVVPQLILCSSALRARLTAEAMIKAAKYKKEIEYLDKFYLAEAQVYLEALQNLPDDLDSVMIIAHNPGLEGLLQILSRKVEPLPTAAIAKLELPIEHWQDLRNETEGKLVKLWLPKDLKEKRKK
ncbi:MAG: histidine phosphatase family protein [Anaerolineaceae bacterium]|nr:histidine phosphatase family protein [Anaerolineaceae bacterium]